MEVRGRTCSLINPMGYKVKSRDILDRFEYEKLNHVNSMCINTVINGSWTRYLDSFIPRTTLSAQ